MARTILKLSPSASTAAIGQSTPGVIGTPGHTKPGYTPAATPRESTVPGQTGGNFELPAVSTGAGQAQVGVPEDE